MKPLAVRELDVLIDLQCCGCARKGCCNRGRFTLGLLALPNSGTAVLIHPRYALKLFMHDLIEAL
jgi:hypothetical protein